MRTVIITGGSSGIGEEICARYLQNNWKVICLSRRHPAQSDVLHIEIDLTAVVWPIYMIQQELEKITGPITLVHNAACFEHDSAFNFNEDYLCEAFRLMILAPARLNKLVAPYMEFGSSIVYVGSTLSEMAVPHAFSYVSLKHATVGMMKASQQDFSKLGVHSCCICPGLTATPMVLKNKAVNDQFLRERVSLGRLVSPSEIAELVMICANNPALNGAVLHANLGQINR